MALYYYLKEESTPQEEKVVPPTPAPVKYSFSFRLLPTFTSVVGLALVSSVLWPILSYELLAANLEAASGRTETGLLNPLIEDTGLSLITGPRVVGNVDFTKASNWFSNLPPVIEGETETGPMVYKLSIPKLNIEDASVLVGGEDLSQSLIHYQGTARPGQLGSPVIFGHSILPQFYNPRNYISIFSLLPTLERGDDIIVEYDGITYTYEVTSKEEVYPDNVSVLEQSYDSKLIKLITCVPPGLKTKRLVVTAKLVG